MPANRLKLTERHVSSLRPGDGDVFLWDATMPGFGCRVKPSGNKSFVLWYRTLAGTKRLYTIGPAAAYRVEQARKEAREWRVKIGKGADPVAEKKGAREAASISELCDRYLSEYAEVHKKPSSAKEDRRLIESRLRSQLGAKKAVAITRADVMRLHHGLRSTPYEANRVLALLSKILNLAEAWGVRPIGSNPCRHMRRYAERKRERFLSDEELASLGAALTDVERTATEQRSVVAAIRLLALTGCRLSEILRLRWQDVDEAQACLRLPDSKTGAKVLPLGAAALELFASLSRDGDYVLPLAGSPAAPLTTSSAEKAWDRIRRKANLSNARLHDLRHSVGTFAGGMGANAFLVRDLLGHKQVSTTARYVERDTNPLRLLADRVSRRVAAAMAGDCAEVLQLPQPKASA